MGWLGFWLMLGGVAIALAINELAEAWKTIERIKFQKEKLHEW